MVELKPMDLGEILDGAMTLYRRHFGLLLRVGVIALWLPCCLTIFVQMTGGPQQHLGLYFVTAVIQYFAGLFLTAGAIRIISDSYLGQPTTVGQAIGLGVNKMMPLFGVGIGKGLLLGLIGGVGAMLATLALPALVGGGVGGVAATVVLIGAAAWGTIFVACGYAVTTQVVVLEPLDGAFDSFGRSWELTRARRLKVFLVALVAFIIFYVPIVGLGATVGALSITDPSQSKVLAVILALLPIVLTPLLSCVFTLLYYDLRIRREGFDLQVLSQQLVSS
jgi:hypothetical protein